MKATESFEKIISDHLQQVASNDSLFAETLKKPNKNIKDCVTYILNTVKASGMNGFADAEVFGMAMHYYDEDNVKIGQPIKANVIVNRSPELTSEEMESARSEAKKQVIKEEMERLRSKPAKQKASKQDSVSLSLFD